MEIIIEGLKAIDNQLLGGLGLLKGANTLMESGETKIAYDLLANLKLDETIDQVNKDKQISDSQIVEILRKRDDGRYKDPEVENVWKALTEE